MSELPPLPEAATNTNRHSGRAGFSNPYGPAYTADQMRAYAAAAVAAERERCRYPACTENEDERCPRWLTGDCAGPDAIRALK